MPPQRQPKALAFLQRSHPALAEFLEEFDLFPASDQMAVPDTELLRELAKSKFSAKRLLLPELEKRTGGACNPDAVFDLCVGGSQIVVPHIALLLSLLDRLQKHPFASVPSSVFLLLPDRSDLSLCRLAESAAVLVNAKAGPRLRAAVLEELTPGLLAAAELASLDDSLSALSVQLRLCGAIFCPSGKEAADSLALWESLAGDSGSLRFQKRSLESIASAWESEVPV